MNVSKKNLRISDYTNIFFFLDKSNLNKFKNYLKILFYLEISLKNIYNAC